MSHAIYAFEVTKTRLRLHEETPKQITHSAEAVGIVRAIIGAIDHERFVVLHLDAKNKVKGFHEAGRGGLSSCALDMVQTFRAALISGASAIIVAHNHPSGDPTPSAEDAAITARIVNAAQLLGIRVLDHVVIGETSHYSFVDQGRMPVAVQELFS